MRKIALQGGKGGLKKKVTASKVARKGSGAATSEKAGKRKPSAPGSSSASPAAAPNAGAGRLAAFEPVTDYSDDEGEQHAPQPMELDEATTATMKLELKRAQTRPTPADAAVVYLGHIPHGFYEEQMRGFFSQFGTVSRLRLARNKRTGRSKHYAFIEFKHAEVGEVVAKAMNGYLLYSKVLVAKVLKPEDVHPETFKGADRIFKIADRVAIVRKQHNAARTPAQASARESRLLSRERRKRKRLAQAGLEYDFPGFEAAAAAPQKRMRGVISDPPADAAATGGERGAAALTAPSSAAAEAVAASKAGKSSSKRKGAHAAEPEPEAAAAPPPAEPARKKAKGKPAAEAPTAPSPKEVKKAKAKAAPPEPEPVPPQEPARKKGKGKPAAEASPPAPTAPSPKEVKKAKAKQKA